MIAQTFHQAVRSLSRRRGFVAVGVAALGLGLGLTTLAVALLDGVLHPDSPYRDSESLYRIRISASPSNATLSPGRLFEKLEASTRSYEAIAAEAPSMQAIRAAWSYQTGVVYRVSANYFFVVGVRPKLGRVFGAASTDIENTAVVSAPLWRKLFLGRAVVGSATISVGSHSYTVIGVMPAELSNVCVADVWIPESMTTLLNNEQSLRASVRVRRGVTAAAAAAELAALSAQVRAAAGSGPQAPGYNLGPLVSSPFRITTYHVAIASAALLVLLIACLNLASMMLARGMSQRRELALRMALGAGRVRASWAMIGEAILVALLGCVVGIVVTLWGKSLLTTYTQAMGWGFLFHFQLSWRVFAACLVAAMASLVIFGLVPAIQVSGLDLSDPLKDSSGTTTGRSRWGYSTVVVVEIALAMTLVMAASLLLRSTMHVTRFDFGYDRKGLFTVWAPPSRNGSIATTTWGAFYEQLRERLAAVPGVRAAATGGSESIEDGVAVGLGGPGEQRSMRLGKYWVVSPDFLRTFGIPVLQGRDFREADAASSGVAIVDQTTARSLWGTANPVGQMIRLGSPGANTSWIPVVGVAHNAVFGIPRSAGEGAPDTLVFVVRRQDQPQWRQTVVRVNPRDPSVAISLSRALPATAPGTTEGMIVEPWLSLYEPVAQGQWFLSMLFSLLGASALGLAAIGVYGVLAYGVKQRAREFSVRMALGASGREVLKLVVRDGAVMASLGTVIGAVLAVGGARFIRSVLYNVKPLDAMALIGSAVVLVVVCVAASVLPALSATRSDPVEMLRVT